MLEANTNSNRKKNKFHLVLICDESGIFDAFRIMKEYLGNRGEVFLSLIYAVPENYHHPLFEREIKILEKRFSHHLYTYTLKVEPGKYDFVQEIIEAIINSNTHLKMQFLIFGHEEFIEYATGVLGYLDMDTYSIQSKIN
ncbi:MAG TPA: hypothetical protein VFG54_08620 [Prolixibacteraceae bacterium]|nr:hypothetical protein [Prolixibacteraceae bacterium]